MLFVLFTCKLSGQELDNAEQLQHQIKKLQDDQDILGVNRIINRNTSLDPEYVLLVITRNLQLAKQVSDQETLADTYLTKGNFWFFQGNKVKAFDNYFQCEIISRNNMFTRLTGLAIMNRSHLVEDTEEKIEMLKESMLFFEKEGDIVNLCKAHLNAGNAYSSFVLGEIGEQSGDLAPYTFNDKDLREADFYKEIVKVIEEYDSNNSYDNIIIASPSFWKEYLIDKIPSSLKKKISLASVSDSSESSFNELLKRDELDKALKDYKVSNELVEVEKVLEAISKDLACYGFNDCKEKINLGSVKKVVVSDNLFKKMKLENKYKELENLIKTCEKMQTEVLICSGKESMEKVDGLGGICGILRWKV